jgi:hypothetical protein
MTDYITRIREIEHRGHLYLGFTYDPKDPGAELPRRTFASRFGYDPAEVISQPGGVLVGPIREGVQNG